MSKHEVVGLRSLKSNTLDPRADLRALVSTCILEAPVKPVSPRSFAKDTMQFHTLLALTFCDGTFLTSGELTLWLDFKNSHTHRNLTFEITMEGKSFIESCGTQLFGRGSSTQDPRKVWSMPGIRVILGEDLLEGFSPVINMGWYH